MSSTDDAGELPDEFTFATQGVAETFVETLKEHRAFCSWCLAPLEVNPAVQFPGEPEARTLETDETYSQCHEPATETIPPKTDQQGQLVETSSERTICAECGVIDIDASSSRRNETLRTALKHVVWILEENDTAINPIVADQAVTEILAEGHTGQFVETLGTAIYRGTDTEG
ncbi:hypothetical protein [Natronococcus occultus]|uniref:Uncharacterized protein n=1 Tax=Natronococcus occultus SP4 TaxID=694430 RepID=L0K5G6_9EURY|nr:hypothetical protein [Natronococcus occultus]AGB39775.1 hypothetical protein Natoc_4355 [Natronococcus occultus SP4]